MTRVHVVVAYGQSKFVAMVQALARDIGGPSTRCQVAPDHTNVVVEFATEAQAEVFRKDIKEHLSTIAFVADAHGNRT